MTEDEDDFVPMTKGMVDYHRPKEMGVRFSCNMQPYLSMSRLRYDDEVEAIWSFFAAMAYEHVEERGGRFSGSGSRDALFETYVGQFCVDVKSQYAAMVVGMFPGDF